MYSFPITVEFEDIDSYGIIHHPKILYYFERTRVHFFMDNNININKIKYGIVLRDISIQYKSQLLLMDKINVELRTKSIDKFRFVFEYTIKKEDKTAIKSEIEFCVIDLDSKRLTEIPDEIRVLLEKIKINDK
ncbi:MAG: hypothetical protein A2086_14380 [Spirochaetes bacterium GWD1_27_9]|nr:MAG: hypothetical protein A2Z98_14445 [Spirochaetes bacterium GWB1_27_13]OHD26076.1 MAG: hypothetical protein A2Y34_03700 [Spirochaetes bacterium GWC1_27_15]OHD41244.1 MAG: hypothetical protein A2086_14380 [Spirochaetes bacterium GWD1_27_9]